MKKSLSQDRPDKDEYGVHRLAIAKRGRGKGAQSPPPPQLLQEDPEEQLDDEPPSELPPPSPPQLLSLPESSRSSFQYEVPQPLLQELPEEAARCLASSSRRCWSMSPSKSATSAAEYIISAP